MGVRSENIHFWGIIPLAYPFGKHETLNIFSFLNFWLDNWLKA